MKVIEFLDPSKNSHIVTHDYLKEFYLNSNHHLLPENIFLKKIIIFINLKILRKIRIILNLIWNLKFNFNEPPQHDIIILDDFDFHILSNIFSKKNYFILPTRTERIKEAYVSKKILFYLLKNFFKRSLKLNYLCSLIEIIRPKTIVTIIDNSDEFFKIAKIFKNRNNKFIAIQRANRVITDFKNKNLYIPNYFVLGNREVEISKDYSRNISKIKPIGSLAATVAKHHFEKNNTQIKENLYDICLCADYNLIINSDFSHIDHVTEHLGLIANHTMRFCKKYKKKIIISGKNDINSERKHGEIIFYKNLVKDYHFDISFHKKSEFGNFKNIIKSKLIIGMTSTMLREAFEFKRKILWCDFIGHEDTQSPSDGICVLKSKKFEDFENRVLEILKLDYEEYLSKINNVNLFYNTKVNALEYLKNEINL